MSEITGCTTVQGHWPTAIAIHVRLYKNHTRKGSLSICMSVLCTDSHSTVIAYHSPQHGAHGPRQTMPHHDFTLES